MTTRNLEGLFRPRSIALIGASNTPGSIGRLLADNLLGGAFAGAVLPVNPKEQTIRSTLAYPSVADLPIDPDLAVIATPAPTVPGLVAELGARGCRAAVVISAGLSAPDIRQKLLDASRPHLLRIVGPNCLGVISPAVGINASFAQLTPRPGGIALVAQSGAITTAAIDWADARGVGFSHVITLGDMADVDFGDLLDYLALDTETKAILLYVENITDARKFMSAGRIAARAKPVVVIKAGRTAAGAKAAYSHTGALAGSDAVYDAAFRRAGMLRVTELRELFDAVTTLSAGFRVHGERLAVITNGGGAGVLAVDALQARGGVLAELAPETIETLNRALPSTWSGGNPVDLIGDAPPERYRAALEAVLSDPQAEAVLVLNCPTALTDGAFAAEATVEVLKKHARRRPILTCWLGERSAVPSRRLFTQHGIPTHATPDEAVRAFSHLVDHARNQALLRQTPPSGPVVPDAPGAQAIVAAARAEGRSALTEPEAKAVLAAYGVPIVESLDAATPEEAGRLAAGRPGAFALKIKSPDITHKTDVGGVALDIPADQVAAAAAAMLKRVAAAAPKARLEGFILQAMVKRPHARELIAGLASDATFGPVVMVGQGGVTVEVVADRAVGLPPLNRVLAREMIGRTRAAKLLAAFRNFPAADQDAIAEVLERLSLMAIEIPEIAELDINPLLADEHGVLALDARISLAAPRGRLSIRPYPADLAHELPLDDGRVLKVRPIRPEDGPGLIDLIERTSAEDVHLRFGGGMRHLPELWAGRLSQIDYDREMALVAIDEGGDILGVSRLVADPEGETGEYALLVRTDQQNHGLGRRLLEAIIDYGRVRGLREVWGHVMSVNDRMLGMASSMGFRRQFSGDPGVIRVVKPLRAEEPAPAA